MTFPTLTIPEPGIEVITGVGDFGDDVHFAEKDGEYFEFTFTGTGVELVTELDPSQGEMDIYVDDVYVQTVDTSNAGRLVQQTVFHLSGLEYGSHTVKAVKTSGIFMLLDQIRVLMPDLITPSAVRYDKADSAETEVTVTGATYGYTLDGIMNGEMELVKEQDYTLADQQVLLKKSYLAAQPNGMTGLLFSFSGGASQTLALTVEDSAAEDSLLETTNESFDKNEAVQQDITVGVAWNGNTLAGISHRGSDLKPGTDYTVNGNQIVLSKAIWQPYRLAGRFCNYPSAEVLRKPWLSMYGIQRRRIAPLYRVWQALIKMRRRRKPLQPRWS